MSFLHKYVIYQEEEMYTRLNLSSTFLHWILDFMEDLNTRSLRMEANGVTPIPPPTRTDTSKSVHS